VSSRVAPEIREYPRTSTTVVNAALLPVVSGYLSALQARLSAAGVGLTPYIMRSNGGVASAQAAAELPAALIASGPAAGVAGAARIGVAWGAPNLLTFDMGGTTADVSLVLDGEPQRRFRGTAAGHPVDLAQVDVLSIGAGGGSLATVDSFGALRVGPESAGSEPGPAGYGRGGEDATLTDAHIVLGTMEASKFLGGAMALDEAAAAHAIKRCVADPLGIAVREAADAVVRMANSNMAQGLRLMSVERGHDPRQLTLVAFGGAGPMHAAALAEQLGMPRVIVPRYPGVTSALGLLMTDFQHDLGRTWKAEVGGVDPSKLAGILDELVAEGSAVLSDAGFGDADAEIALEADMRYTGQAYELTVPLRLDADPGALLQGAEEAFHLSHERAYGHARPRAGVEITTLRVCATGKVEQPRLVPSPPTNGHRPASLARQATISSEKRYARVDGDEVNGPVLGPALVLLDDATVIVPPAWSFAVDERDVSVLERVAS
jgi:N-methylhydantoinase A